MRDKAEVTVVTTTTKFNQEYRSLHLIKSIRGGSNSVTDIESLEEFEEIIASENNANKVFFEIILIFI